ncbi:MAG: MFS transporter, partial [Alphaproteobacteria bacterium]
PYVVVPALSGGLILNQLGIMAVPSLIPQLSELWRLDEAEIGGLGSIYFAGYALALPFMSGAAGRMDGRLVYAFSAVVGACASLGFALLADGYWTAMVLRLIAGAGFAGVHIIGMKLLVDRLDGEAQARASAVYTGAFAIGSGLSYLAAGFLARWANWEAVFVAAAVGSLLSIPVVASIGAPAAGVETRSKRLLPDFGAALRDREIMRYVVAYAGNLWEVFAIRVWIVPLLAFSAARSGGGDGYWEPTTVAGLSVFIAVPANLAIAELGIRFGRRKAIGAVSLASVAVCLALGWLPQSPYEIVLALLLLHAVTSYGDVGAIAGGVSRATTSETRAAALALFGLIGFSVGFLGPLSVGLAIDAVGGMAAPLAWFCAFAAIAVGSVISGLAMVWRARRE